MGAISSCYNKLRLTVTWDVFKCHTHTIILRLIYWLTVTWDVFKSKIGIVYVGNERD